MRINVPPTGNPTTDTEAIQQALDSSTDAAWKWVCLDGHYKINNTIRVPKTAKLDGGWRSPLDWVGDSDVPMIEANGPVENLLLSCRGRASGLSLHGVTYRHALGNVYVFDSGEYAFKLRDCWGASVNDIRATKCDGVAIDADRCNSSYWQSLVLSQCRQALRMSRTDLVIVESLTCEAMQAAGPLFALRDCSNTILRSVRMEGNANVSTAVEISTVDATFGKAIRLESWRATAHDTMPVFIRVDGRSDVTLAHSDLRNVATLAEGVIRQEHNWINGVYVAQTSPVV